MKYKELPASVLNDFKVGDNVRVYDTKFYKSETYTIKETSGCTVGFDESSYKVYHQQCRKLEEFKPREFWVKPGMENTYAESYRCFWDGSNDMPNEIGWIRVREILEDE